MKPRLHVQTVHGHGVHYCIACSRAGDIRTPDRGSVVPVVSLRCEMRSFVRCIFVLRKLWMCEKNHRLEVVRCAVNAFGKTHAVQQCAAGMQECKGRGAATNTHLLPTGTCGLAIAARPGGEGGALPLPLATAEEQNQK
jgi:hypothetical protein